VKPKTDSSRWRAISTTLDYVMSSISNGLIVLAVARVASVDTFGAAALLVTISAAALGVGRGAVGTPIMLAAGSGPAELRREAGFASTAMLVFGLAFSCVAVVASCLLGTPGLGAAFALAIPLAVVADVFRYALISASKPHLALTWDALWALGSGTLFVITLFWRHTLTAVTILFCWALLAGISALGLAMSYRQTPYFRGIASWWRTMYRSRLRYGIEGSLGQVNDLIVTSIATALIGTSAAAAIRGAALILTPFALLLGALPLVLIPEAVRGGASATELWSKLCRIGFVSSLSIVAIGSALWFLPARVGQLILGDSWDFARDVLPIISINYFAVTWGIVAMTHLRFQGKSGQLLAGTVAYCLTSSVLCTAMALMTRTAMGIAVGLTVSAVAVAIGLVLHVHLAHLARLRLEGRSRG